MFESTFVRVAAVLALLVTVLAATATGAQAKQAYQYMFEDSNGNVVLSDVHLALWDAGDGDYIAKLTFTPTQNEINALLKAGSHVDFAFTFRGLQESGSGVDLVPAVSDDVREVGAVVVDGTSGPVYKAMGLNIANRWVAGKPVIVLALISGYEPYAQTSVSVELKSSEWRFADGNCKIAYQRTTNNETLSYCTQDKGHRATLVDQGGDNRFPI